MKKFLILFSVSLLIPFYAQAQRGIDYPKHYIGGSYSEITGAGVSYLMEINRNLSFAVSGFYYYDGLESYNRNTIGNIGLELQQNLYYETKFRIFAFAGYTNWQDITRRRLSYLDGDIPITENSLNHKIYNNVGLGIGYEHLFFNKISIGLSLGVIYQDIEKINEIDYPKATKSVIKDSKLDFKPGLFLRFSL